MESHGSRQEQACWGRERPIAVVAPMGRALLAKLVASSLPGQVLNKVLGAHGEGAQVGSGDLGEPWQDLQLEGALH